jgi:hypothetical protein
MLTRISTALLILVFVGLRLIHGQDRLPATARQHPSRRIALR